MTEFQGTGKSMELQWMLCGQSLYGTSRGKGQVALHIPGTQRHQEKESVITEMLSTR